jgi:PAS domain S-box-containing protein
MKYSFKELVDVNTLQKLTDELYTAASIPSAIISIDGEVLTGSGWQRICTDFHRQHSQIEKECIESDTKIREKLDQGETYAIYKCPRGLVDASSPVIIAGEHVVNVFAGQVFLEPPDENIEQFFREQAKKFRFDEIEYIKAFREIPIFTNEEFKAVLKFLSILAQLIGQMGLTRLNELESTEELRKSEERYRKLVEGTDNLITKVDQHGKFTYVNYVGEKIFGIKVNNLVGMSAFNCLYAEDQEKTRIWFDECVRKKIVQSSIENRQISKSNDEVFHMLWTCHFRFDENNKLIEVNSIAHNITERKKIEQILCESEYQYRTTLDSMKDIIHVMDTNYCLILTNNEFKKEVLKLGIEQEVIGENLFKLFPFLPESAHQEYQQVYEKGKLLITEENLEIQGKSMYTETRKIPILKNNRVVQIVTIVRDITEKKVMEEVLKKSHYELEQKVVERTAALQQEIDERKQMAHNLLESRKEAEHANKAKSEFLSNLSHEFRTPMHQILSYSKFGVDKIDKVKKEKLHHYFTKIGTIGQSLLALLNDLLDLSKLESGKVEYDMKITHLQSIISNIIGEFHSLIDEKRIILEKNIASSVLAIKCDEIKIGQVVRNLFSNAIKFTSNNKKVSILVKSSEFLINGKKLVPAVLFTVSDQGIGIPNDELESVFDKFVQSSNTKTNAGGTGLGLAICKEIIQAHNGKIWAENNPEGGATFSFMLPYKQEVN